MKAVIIIPTYNEKGNIKKLVETLETDVFPEIKTWNMHILVVDDDSPDGTAKEVEELIKKYKNLHLLHNGEKAGLGAAYIKGMSLAVEKLTPDVLFEMDADGQHDPKKIPDFLKKIDEGNDLVIGTRYSQGGSIPENWPPIRKIYSIFGNLLVRTIFGRFAIHDWTGGYRAMRVSVFLKEKNEMGEFRGYTFQVSFLHKAARDGFKIAEVPFHFTDRTLGNSKIAPGEYIVDLLRYVITARFREVLHSSFPKFLIVGGFGFFINAFLYDQLVRNTHLPIALANVVAAQFAIFSNYNFNNVWTFKAHKANSVLAYFSKMLQFFATSNIGVILIQSGTIQIGDMLYGEQYYRIYFLIGTFFLLIWNFTVYSKVIWKKKTAF
ncbi:MAG: glycosyltransferase [bacterium]|nr:glycosyltransferase [bacterium]